MKKIILALVLIALVFPLASAAADIGYILKNSGSPDSAITDSIAELGKTYEVIDDSQLSSTDFSQYSMILVGDGNFGSYLQYIPVNQKNALLVNTYHLDEWHWDSGNTAFSTSSQSRGQVINFTSPVTENVSMFFFMYNQGNTNFYYMNSLGRGPGVLGMASPDDRETDFVIATVSPGALLKDSVRADAKGVFFGLPETSKWNTDTKTLFKNSILWLIGDEDTDEDGYPARVDCNDHDDSINPGADEIPYDGIDQDCQDGDLRDVDHDGYEAEIVGGDDCNDNNPSINPGETSSARNCVNENPELDGEIPSVEWDEDDFVFIDLDDYFFDPDGDNLNYNHDEHITSDNEHVLVWLIGDSLVKFNSTENWNGDDWIIFKAIDPDGLSVYSNNITLKVNPVNDAPIIYNSAEVFGVEGSIIEIIANASDPEGDSITYSSQSDIPLIQEGNVFRWQTSTSSAGTYTVFINAEDTNGLKSSKKLTIKVSKKIVINEFVSDPQEGNEWVELYNPGSNSFGLSNCTLVDGSGHEKTLNGELLGKKFKAYEFNSSTLNNDGDIVSLYCSGQLIDKVVYGNWDPDNKGTEKNAPVPSKGESAGRDPDGHDTDNDSEDFRIFSTPTKEMKNNADVIIPEVDVTSPENNAVFNETRDVNFEFIARDNAANSMDCSLYINDAKISTKGVQNDTTSEFLRENMNNGDYSWYVECNDGYGKGKSETRVFSVSSPSGPNISPISDKSVDEGQLIEFTITATNEAGGNLVFSIDGKPGSAEFVDNNNGSAEFSWQTGFSDSGTYDVKFSVENEAGIKSSKIVKMEVKNVEQPRSFEDAQECLVQSGMIKLDIKDPDNGDDFDIGSTIDVEVKVDNDFDEDLEFDIEVYLYNIDEDESIEDVDDSVDIDEGDSETVDFELEIPDDAEDSEHVVYVYVESEDGECVSDYVEIELNREDDNVKISDLFINPKVVYPGESVEVEVEVENIGGDDQDVLVKIEVPDLNILQESEEFEVEKYGDDDKESEVVRFTVPSDAEPKEYQIIATIYFSGKEETLTESIIVLREEDKPITNNNVNNDFSFGSTIDLGNSYNQPIITNEDKPVVSEDVNPKPEQKKEIQKEKSGNNTWMFVLAILLVMCVVVEIIIIKVAMDRE